MKKIAVVGIGAIGGIVGGGLAAGGQDVTLICTSWRENAEYMKQNGLTMLGPDGIEKNVKVKALFIDELDKLPSKIEVLLIAVKSNDTLNCLKALKPHLDADACVISLQNGINEDVIIPVVGKEKVAACVSYTGGILLRPGYVRGHGGKLVIGELNGEITPRIKELQEILSSVTTTEISTDIVKERWNKLANVTMTVTAGAIAGVGFPSILMVEKSHPLQARILLETLRVAAADGHPLEQAAGLKKSDWERVAEAPVPELSDIIIGPFRSMQSSPSFNPDESPLLKDIKLGLPLEIEYTNGYVIKKGRELGVPTTVHELVVKTIEDIENGKIKPGMDLLDKILTVTAVN